MAIQMRRGNQVDFDPTRMLPGEWAVSLDSKKIYMCYSPGQVVEIGSASSILPYIEEAEAWARGTKDGEPVSSSDPTYHNNSKYYSEQSNALGQAQAQNSEAYALGNKGGSAVPSTDPAYHNNSK